MIIWINNFKLLSFKLFLSKVASCKIKLASCRILLNWDKICVVCKTDLNKSIFLIPFRKSDCVFWSCVIITVFACDKLFIIFIFHCRKRKNDIFICILCIIYRRNNVFVNSREIENCFAYFAFYSKVIRIFHAIFNNSVSDCITANSVSNKGFSIFSAFHINAVMSCFIKDFNFWRNCWSISRANLMSALAFSSFINIFTCWNFHSFAFSNCKISIFTIYFNAVYIYSSCTCQILNCTCNCIYRKESCA